MTAKILPCLFKRKMLRDCTAECLFKRKILRAKYCLFKCRILQNFNLNERKGSKLDLNKSVAVQHLLSVTVVLCILHLPKPKPEVGAVKA